MIALLTLRSCIVVATETIVSMRNALRRGLRHEIDKARKLQSDITETEADIKIETFKSAIAQLQEELVRLSTPCRILYCVVLVAMIDKSDDCEYFLHFSVIEI